MCGLSVCFSLWKQCWAKFEQQARAATSITGLLINQFQGTPVTAAAAALGRVKKGPAAPGAFLCRVKFDVCSMCVCLCVSASVCYFLFSVHKNFVLIHSRNIAIEYNRLCRSFFRKVSIHTPQRKTGPRLVFDLIHIRTIRSKALFSACTIKVLSCYCQFTAPPPLIMLR